MKQQVSGVGPDPNFYAVLLPFPPASCWPNSRSKHWRANAGARAKQRADAKHCALAALGTARPRLTSALVSAQFRCYRAGRKGGRLPDRDNCIAALKGAMDGLVDAGLFADDAGVRWGEVEPIRVMLPHEAGVLLTLSA